jgi:DNA (cytosine-5)-methyltransferase 1
MIKVGSDFSGVGAFNQALIRLGIEYKELFACDLDKYARQTFIHNYGEPKYYPTNVYERKIPKESLDIYMTSPPCQAFSKAGKKLGKEDKRGILFFNSYEFIQVNKPRYFIFENVRGLLSNDNGNTFQEWINMLGGKSVNGVPVIFPYEESVPYHLYWQVLNAKNHGIPQNRERVFLIGIRDDLDNNFQFPKEEHLTKKLKDVLEENINKKYFLSDKMIDGFTKHNENHNKKGTGFIFIPKDENDIANCLRANAALAPTDNTIIVFNTNPSGKGMNGCIYDEEGIAPTLWSGHGEGLKIKSNKIRRLTPRECFRLMDFPDTFTWNVSDSQAYKQAGNSIVVNVLYKIIKNLNL